MKLSDVPVAIIGVGATHQGELPGLSGDEIAVDALRLALADAGIAKSQLDGLVTCRSYGGQGVDTDIGRLLGLNPSFSATLDYGTCNFSLHLAIMAIRSGLANTVALTYGTNQRTAKHRFANAASDAHLTEPHGFYNVAGPAAMAFARHKHLYGTTEEQLGHVAVGQRQFAQLNPMAIFRDELTLENYLAAPYIVEPLRRPDITMISDGGAALIVTRADRIGDLDRTPVFLVAMAQSASLRDNQTNDNLMRPWIGDTATRLYRDSPVSREDVDVLFIQDPFSVWVLQMLEWYGFCPVGEGGPFLAEGRTAPGGALPLNTNGGQLSEAYMWGWLHLCEAVRQLRGEAGPRQVKGASIAQYCSTMAFKKAAATILSKNQL